MTDPVGLQAVVYAVDLDRLSVFYRAVCDLDVVEHVAGEYTVLAGDAVLVSIVAMPREIAVRIEISSPPTRVEDASIKLSFPVADLALARVAAAATGGRIDNAEREWDFRGHRVCHGHDPEGNVVSFREPV